VTDVQRGTIDLSQAIVPDVNSFGVEPFDHVDVDFTGPNGTTLWLLQNNVSAAQPALALHYAHKNSSKGKKTHRRGR
jgi:hypothetical protein